MINMVIYIETVIRNKKGGTHKSGSEQSKYGKDGHHDRGKVETEDKGFNKESGHDSHHKHHDKYGESKHGHNGKEYGYKTSK